MASLYPEIITRKLYSFQHCLAWRGPVSYWLALTYCSNPFLIFCVAHELAYQRGS
ncbi:hypothetical protein ACRRTK_012028 [Alexandromys fortis]